jgi:hypothetical protein
VPIVGCPQVDQLVPFARAVVLASHPRFLIVVRKGQLIDRLHPDVALMVVRRRVDQMTENLESRSSSRAPWSAHVSLRQRTQCGLSRVHNLQQITPESV